jgi:hypothetical protein
VTVQFLSAGGMTGNVCVYARSSAKKSTDELERWYAHFQGLRADYSCYDGGSDTVSIVRSEDDMWAH